MAKQQGDSTANTMSGTVHGMAVQAHTVYLQSQTVEYRAPSALPPVVRHFVNRDEQRAAMSTLYTEDLAKDRVSLLALLGQDGVGRFSAAVRWYRETPERFPDGHLHVRLGGADRDDSAAIGERLGELLVNLGMVPKDLPSTPDGRRTALLNKTSGRKLLLVVENVTRAASVKWFELTTPGSAVLVTASPKLAPGLIRHGYRRVDFDGLQLPHRLDLFHHILGPVAEQVPAAQLEKLARSFGGLPLALEVIASQVAARPKRVRRVLQRIDELGLDAVDVEGQVAVRESFDAAYAEMDEDLRAAYRRLAGHPGLAFDLAAATVLLGADAEDLLAELAEFSLVSGQYRLDELVWRDAASRATDADRDPAAIVRHYLHNAVVRDACLTQRPRSGPLFGRLTATEDEPEARAWLIRNREALRGAVLLAEEHGLDAEAWQLCEALWALYHQYGYYDDWITTHQAGLAAARRLENDAAVMRMAGQLGSAHFALGELDRADELFAEQHTYAVRAGDGSGQQSALEWRGKVAAKQKRTAEADDLFRQSWAATEELVPEADRPRTFALLHLQLGRLHGSVEHLLAAQEYFNTTTERDNQAKVALELGRLQGKAPLLRALELFTGTKSLSGQLNALRALAALDSQYQDRVVELEIMLGRRAAD